MKIDRFTTYAQYAQGRRNRQIFAEALDRLCAHPPRDVHHLLVQAQKDAYRAAVADFDLAIVRWERDNGGARGK